MRVRRVVTGKNTAGKSGIISDGASPREMVLEHTPGFVSSPLWRVDGAPDLTGDPRHDAIEAGGTMVLGEGGSSFWVITFPPDSSMANWDPMIAGSEMAEASPGIAERMEPENPGMHETPTLDYVTVVKGTISLELDDGKIIDMYPGDTLVQQGARHAWRNRTEEPATISVVLLGAKT